MRHDSIHHRRPKSIGGGNDSRNLLRCSHKQHQAFHLLFQNWEVPRIIEELNRWIDPEWTITAKRKPDAKTWQTYPR
jgi:hypothetical protein